MCSSTRTLAEDVGEPKRHSERGDFAIFRRSESADSLNSEVNEASGGINCRRDAEETSAVFDEDCEGFTSFNDVYHRGEVLQEDHETEHGEGVSEEDQETNDEQSESIQQSRRIRKPPVWISKWTSRDSS